MRNRIAGTLRSAADFFFGPENGAAEILVMDLDGQEEFIQGHRRGHQDAYAILHGIADYFEEESDGEAVDQDR